MQIKRGVLSASETESTHSEHPVTSSNINEMASTDFPRSDTEHVRRTRFRHDVEETFLLSYVLW